MDDSSSLSPKQFFYCKACESSRKLRIKHCVKCDACVYKYDHHCFWIGNCVGELNQRVFYGFLTAQTAVNVCAAWGFFTIAAQNPVLVVGNVVMGVTAACFGVFTVTSIFIQGFLLIYHTMLAATNQTTWEHIRRHRITYLKELPKGMHPFSNGLVANLKQFFLEAGPTDWKLDTTR